jgi:uncharacterized protein YndB with AHSA1/START domain
MAVLAAGFSLALHGEVKTASADGFVVVQARHIDAEPAKVFAALVAIGGWWDGEHSYSGSATNMTLEPVAGGCFCERWKDGQVEHGRVIMVMRDRALRLQTALGPLQGRAVDGVLTFQLQADEASGGKATQLTLTYVVNGASGSGLDKNAPVVDGVLAEQMDRLASYIQTGTPARR